jgi:hypothetical protein
MSNEMNEPKRRYFAMPENLAELSDEELEKLADDIYSKLFGENLKDSNK